MLRDKGSMERTTWRDWAFGFFERRDQACGVWREVKPYALMILMQFGFAGMTIIAKFALNEGMSTYTLVVYRHALAAMLIAPFALVLERNASSSLTLPIFLKIMALGLLEPVMDQNLYYLGMKYTTATFTAALSNVVPAITIIIAWILRMERMELREVRSITKLAGTAISLTGAMVMTLYKGPVLRMGSSRGERHHGPEAASAEKDLVKGSIFLVLACSCVAVFLVLQTITLREYPLPLSLAALICLTGAVQGVVVALPMVRGSMVAWSIDWDIKLLAIVYAAVVCSGLAYCLQGSVMTQKGPVFVTAFIPLSMIIVAIAGLFFLAEDLTVGMMIGAILIISGLYMVVWGKSRDGTEAPHDQDTGVRSEQQAGVVYAPRNTAEE